MGTCRVCGFTGSDVAEFVDVANTLCVTCAEQSRTARDAERRAIVVDCGTRNVDKSTRVYKFATLDPRPGAANPVLSTPCLGIEVTVSALADRCSLGNIDSQHGNSRGPWAEFASGHAAIAVASWSEFSYAALPPDGSTLVTIRPDVDSIGAMAVIVLRRDREDHDFDAETLARIALIAERDSFVPGGAWAPRALPTAERPWGSTAAPVSETQSLAPIAAICSPARGQTQLPIEMRVAIVACWLLYGAPGDERWVPQRDVVSAIGEACGCPDPSALPHDMPSSTPTLFAAALADRYADAAKSAVAGRMEMVRALDAGEIAIGLRGGVSVVESAHIGAMGLGYHVAPIVVAAMPQDAHGRRKVTIAQWSKGHVDLGAVAADLSEREPGWGGTPTIVGSPQGSGSALALDDVIEAVRSRLTPTTSAA